jgi:hypothetical protein
MTSIGLTRIPKSHPIDPAGMLARASGRPGPGLEIDLEVVAKHPFEPSFRSACSRPTAASAW